MVSTRLQVILSAFFLLSTAEICRADAIFTQTNLVSSIPGLAAFTDSNLKNPWGIASSATSPFWIANEVTAKATIYNGSGMPQALVVTIPGTGGNPGAPTGIVFNNTGTFLLGNGANATFLFAGLDGVISGWNGAAGTSAMVVVSPTDGAAYTGLAIGNIGAASRLYAADAANNKIDVFDPNYQKLSGRVRRSDIARRVHRLQHPESGRDAVRHLRKRNVRGRIVNAFDLDGNFLRRVTNNSAGGPLEGPRGLASRHWGSAISGAPCWWATKRMAASTRSTR